MYGYGWHRPKFRPEKRKAKSESFRLLRLNAQIQRQLTREIIDGRLMSTDLTATGIGLFLNQPVGRDELVTLALSSPHHLYVKGRVRWCSLHTMQTKVLSTDSFMYRVYIEFYFDSPEEREALRNFIF